MSFNFFTDLHPANSLHAVIQMFQNSRSGLQWSVLSAKTFSCHENSSSLSLSPSLQNPGSKDTHSKHPHCTSTTSTSIESPPNSFPHSHYLHLPTLTNKPQKTQRNTNKQHHHNPKYQNAPLPQDPLIAAPSKKPSHSQPQS